MLESMHLACATVDVLVPELSTSSDAVASRVSWTTGQRLEASADGGRVRQGSRSVRDQHPCAWGRCSQNDVFCQRLSTDRGDTGKDAKHPQHVTQHPHMSQPTAGRPTPLSLVRVQHHPPPRSCDSGCATMRSLGVATLPCSWSCWLPRRRGCGGGLCFRFRRPRLQVDGLFRS
jgi:hypothetical protein